MPPLAPRWAVRAASLPAAEIDPFFLDSAQKKKTMGNAQSLASQTGRVDINTVLQDVSGLDNNGKVSVGGSDFSRLRAIACRNVTAGKGMVGDESGAAG